MTLSYEAHAQRPPAELPPEVFSPVDTLQRAQGLIASLDALAEVSMAWGQHKASKSVAGRTEFEKRYGKKDAAEILGSAATRTAGWMLQAREQFRLAAGYPLLEKTDPLRREVEDAFDEDFMFFKVTYCTGADAAAKRDTYRAELEGFVAEESGLRVVRDQSVSTQNVTDLIA